MCLIQYDECIKDCDKAVEKDRKLRPGKEQLEKVSTGSRQERLVLLALLLLRIPSPLMRMCSPQSCDQSVGERGLSLKLRVWIGGSLLRITLKHGSRARKWREWCAIWRPKKVRVA